MSKERALIKRHSKIRYIAILLLVLWLQTGFSQHLIINSGWQFSKDKTSWETINIPHTWNAKDAFDDEPGYRRGLGFYKKQIYFSNVQKDNIHYLKFDGINQEATVYVNGQLVGDHKGGYTAFNFDISSFLNYGTYNLIEVTVDNSYNEDIPPLDADFTFYGGIYRDVELISLPKQHFSLNDFASDGFYVNYINVSKAEATLEIEALLKNDANEDKNAFLDIQLFDENGKAVQSHTEKLKLPAEASNKYVINLPKIYGPHLWSPDHPYLYTLKLSLSENGILLDTKTGHVGFRWLKIDPEKGLFLNGRPLKLIG
ncbi:MAG TPA: hypothetical protein VJ945_00010, partial [Flavobacteriaceae bacterium]|nr:hypothetical protein [Flavobacteriaceae bacterium]